MELRNSTVLITGGTSGIGLELVKQLTEQGANILITGRHADALKKTKAMFPKVHTFQSDVGSLPDIQQLYREVSLQFPELNILINNAGLMRLIDLMDHTLSLDDINREIATNLTGTIQMVQQFLPHLLKKKTAAIVNVSSGIAFMAYSAAPVYSAAKAGVRAYTQALRLQLEHTNVKVFEMIPPGVKTNLQNDWAIQPDPRMMMDVDKMVRVAITGLQKDKPELEPAMIKVIKVASRIAPKLLLNMGHKELKKIKEQTKNTQQ